MKIAKRLPLLTVLLFVVSLVCSAVLVVVASTVRGRAVADEPTNKGLTYYYDELKNSELAQKFYHVFEEMNEKDSYLDGKTGYDLTPVVTQSALSGYLVHGESDIPVALGAARDAFYMDHPDLFYVDIYKLGLSVGTKDDGTFAAYLDTGRADNYYYHQDVKSVTDVGEQRKAYNKALDEVVAKVTASGTSVVERIKSANAEIANIVEYDLGALKDKYDNVVYNPYVHTAYGALVEGKALCDGYATAFKAVMDRLNIPCVLIQGAANSGIDTVDDQGNVLTSGYGPHMWNAVEVDGLWYCVDVTWNDTCDNLQKYLLVGEEFITSSHIANGVISSTGFELKYPALRALGYGVNTDASGFTFKDSGKIGDEEFGYIADDAGFFLTLGIAYDGKNVVELAEDGRYFAYRYNFSDGWDSWNCVVAMVEEFAAGDAAYYEEFMAGYCFEEYTRIYVTSEAKQIQIAVFSRKPNEGFTYTDAELTGENVIDISVPYSNDWYMTHLHAPSVIGIDPTEYGYIENFDPQQITLRYDEELALVDKNAAVGIEVTGKSANLGEHVKVRDVVWDGSKTITFTLTPSPVLAHDGEAYYFTPTNLVGKDSKKIPNSGRLAFKRESIVCPKVYNDGRLFMKVFGEPQFVSASDESLSDFKDQNGQPIVGDQRTQLMLVVNSPSKSESAEMETAAKEQTGLADGDIKASATYQIDLHMCGFLQKVPTGSYMQVGFGFPEGYGPDDAGVTFTVYHYKRGADGKITEVETVPCVITEIGIIATVKSFSPFMICAVDSNSAAVADMKSKKTVLASVDGIGGTVDKLDIETVESGSITYTITEEAGYGIDRVLFNGTDVKDKLTEDGKLTLGYSELASSNTVVVSFIADRLADVDAERGVTRIHAPNLVVTDKDMIKAYAHGTEPTAPSAPKKNNVGLIVGVVVAVVVVLAAVGVALYFILRKKKTATETAAPASKEKSTIKTVAPAKKETAATKSNVTASNKTAAPKVDNTHNRSTAAAQKPVSARPASSTQNRPASTQTRPTGTTSHSSARPTSSQSRPTSNSARPTSSNHGNASRPTSGSARPTSNRPTSTTHSSASRPTSSTSRPTDKNRK